MVILTIMEIDISRSFLLILININNYYTSDSEGFYKYNVNEEDIEV